MVCTFITYIINSVVTGQILIFHSGSIYERPWCAVAKTTVPTVQMLAATNELCHSGQVTSLPLSFPICEDNNSSLVNRRLDFIQCLG